MKNYYFTFGQAHYNIWGEPMKDVWVRVVASGWAEARRLFVAKFTSNFMEKPDHWSMQYNESEFHASAMLVFFRCGEYAVIVQDKDLITDKQH